MCSTRKSNSIEYAPYTHGLFNMRYCKAVLCTMYTKTIEYKLGLIFVFIVMTCALDGQPVVQSHIWEKLFVTTDCEVNVVSSCADFKQCHKVVAFDNRKIGTQSSRTHVENCRGLPAAVTTQLSQPVCLITGHGT